MTSCCESGTAGPDSYEPYGEFTTVGLIQLYETLVPQPNTEKGLLLLLPDGFGHATHNLILADKFAQEGWHVVIPDYFEGDALPIQYLKRNEIIPPEETVWSEEDERIMMEHDFSAWLERHNPQRVSLLLDELVAHLSQRYPEMSTVGVGYCFGGKHVLRLAKTSLKAAVSFHPSFVEAEDMDEIQAPIYVGLAEEDTMVPATLASDLRSWSKDRFKEGVPLTLEMYPNVGHGFAARPNHEDKEVKAQYTKAFQRTIAFLTRNIG